MSFKEQCFQINNFLEIILKLQHEIAYRNSLVMKINNVSDITNEKITTNILNPAFIQ